MPAQGLRRGRHRQPATPTAPGPSRIARLHNLHPEDEAMTQNRVRGLAARPALTLLGAVAALLAAGAGTARAQTDLVDFNFTGNSGTADPVDATAVATGLVMPVQLTRVGPNMVAQGQ